MSNRLLKIYLLKQCIENQFLKIISFKHEGRKLSFFPKKHLGHQTGKRRKKEREPEKTFK